MSTRPPTPERIYAAVYDREAHTADQIASVLHMTPTRELHEMIDSMVIAGNLHRSSISRRLAAGYRPDPVRRRQSARAGAGTPTRRRYDGDRAPDTAAAAVPHAPSAVIPGTIPGQRSGRQRVEYRPEWIVGRREEDQRVKYGLCPWQIQPDGGGQKEIFCGAERSRHEADWPYCRKCAAQIREQRGYDGYVG